MTTIPFLPNSNASPPFAVLVTLDGNSYVFASTWNLYRGDWYYSLTDQSGNLVIHAPLIESPANANIYLAPGVFANSTILYRSSTENIEVTP